MNPSFAAASQWFVVYAKFVVFGLMAYSASGLINLYLTRSKEKTASPLVLRLYFRIYASMIGFQVLGISRYIWDATHIEHFPTAVHEICHIILYTSLGRAVYKLAQHKNSDRNQL